jgi:hypothetical protein
LAKALYVSQAGGLKKTNRNVESRRRKGEWKERVQPYGLTAGGVLLGSPTALPRQLAFVALVGSMKLK